MQLHELSTNRISAKGRVGRGIASGQGKTAGRGTKGQKSRTGFKIPKRIPGMMSASDYRLPKNKGFKSQRAAVALVTLRVLDQVYKDGETVSPDSLVAKKVINGYTHAGVKLVATGTLTKKLKFESIKMSAKAEQLTKQTTSV